MNRQDQEAKESASVPCVQGCGFFGQASTNNMCSKCFKQQSAVMESTKKSTVPAANSVVFYPSPAEKPAPSVQEAVPALATSTHHDKQDSSKRVKVVDRSRCAECRKKVGLTAVECRCGHVYCASHRMAEMHACPFDYKSHGRMSLEKANERVVAESLAEKL